MRGQLSNTDGDLTPEAAEIIRRFDQGARQTRPRREPRRVQPQRRDGYPLGTIVSIIGAIVVILIILFRRDENAPTAPQRNTVATPFEPQREQRTEEPSYPEVVQEETPQRRSQIIPAAETERRPTPQYREIEIDRPMVENFIASWRSAWESMNIESFMAFYHQDFYSIDKQLGYWDYYQHENNLFNCYRYIKVTIGPPAVWAEGDRITVQFYQRYNSGEYQDEGIKTLYIVDTDGGLRIIGEDFQRLR